MVQTARMTDVDLRLVGLSRPWSPQFVGADQYGLTARGGRLMVLYIECFYADGSQILGNLDGQAVMHTSPQTYRRTEAYKRLSKIVKNPKWMCGKVDHAKIITPDGVVLEVVK